MSLLLDTHVVLWWMYDDATLSTEVKDAIDDEDDVFVSAGSVWEVAIKQATGRLDGPDQLPERILASGLRPLAITTLHGITAARLPSLHRDPFDRLLVAQALVEGLTLATRDRQLQQYDVPLLRV